MDMKRTLLGALAVSYVFMQSACSASYKEELIPTPTAEVLPSATFEAIVAFPTQTPSPEPSHTAVPSQTPSATPTITPTLVPTYQLTGRVFFDMNGSGLQDIAYSFADGELVEQAEPVIEGVSICIKNAGKESCTVSGSDGTYLFEGLVAGSILVNIESPTEDPETAFRYINIYNGPSVIPAYEMNGVQVPEQHLSDTEIKTIDTRLVHSVPGEAMNIALMQGFLTLPYRVGDSDTTYGYHGFDHDGTVGRVLGYDGLTSLVRIDPNIPTTMYGEGIEDGHTGIDWGMPIGAFIVASAPGSVVNRAGISINQDVRHGFYVGGRHETMSVFGHLSFSLVNQGQWVQRGQIVAASGISGTAWPHLHFDLLFGEQNLPEPDDYLPNGYQKDPFGVVMPIEVNFPNERWSSWTVFNNPQYALTTIGNQ